LPGFWLFEDHAPLGEVVDDPAWMEGLTDVRSYAIRIAKIGGPQ
jgi:hypothetical protein